MKQAFKIQLSTPIAGKWFGAFLGIMKWIGIEKTDTRKYVAGDSQKSVNRKASAKYQELYTTVFHQEKALSLDFFLDINYNRRWGEPRNVDQVQRDGEEILEYSKQHGIRVTLYAPSTSLFGLSMKLKKIIWSKDAFQKILATIKNTKKRYQSRLKNFLQEAMQVKEKRVIVIFSDFLAMDEEDVKLLKYLKKQHILFLFKLPIDVNEGQNYNEWMMKDRGNTHELEFI